jgi:DNA repair protein RecN (Recombination protein N)
VRKACEDYWAGRGDVTTGYRANALRALELPPSSSRKVRVFVDAGHGAPDNTGNTGCYGQSEQDHTLAVARHLAFVLSALGRFEVALTPVDTPQAFGLESTEFLVAGHAGSSPRPLAKVASGGELSRLALAIAVTTCRAGAAQGAAAPTLIFDEIDAGVGGSVAYQVGRMMKQLGGSSQVLAVTHLAQVAACADHHFVVSKAPQGQATVSDVRPVVGEARVSEVARMLGGERLAGTSRAHAEAMLGGDDEPNESKPARTAHKQR